MTTAIGRDFYEQSDVWAQGHAIGSQARPMNQRPIAAPHPMRESEITSGLLGCEPQWSRGVAGAEPGCLLKR